jgi:hypothetical protein
MTSGKTLIQLINKFRLQAAYRIRRFLTPRSGNRWPLPPQTANGFYDPPKEGTV